MRTTPKKNKLEISKNLNSYHPKRVKGPIAKKGGTRAARKGSANLSREENIRSEDPTKSRNTVVRKCFIIMGGFIHEKLL